MLDFIGGMLDLVFWLPRRNRLAARPDLSLTR
jgi:hypothetical protein